MLDNKNLYTLGKTLALANPTSSVAYSFADKSYSYKDLDDTFRSELNELVGNYQLWRENKNTLFTLLEEIVTEVLPVKVMEQYGAFAEIKTYNQNEMPTFKIRVTEASKKRARGFVSKVGLAGRYEVFKLDGSSFTVTTSAYGAACQVAIEELLDGRANMAEFLQIAMEGLDEMLYAEIAASLHSIKGQLPAMNVVEGNAFDRGEFNRLLSIADSYGSGKATIYCTFEFAATIIPGDKGWTDAMRQQVWDNGYLGNYMGHNVVVLRQSYTDKNHNKLVIDPSYCWIIPGGAEKPVKIALEGTTLMREVEHDDWSRDIQFYKKMGVGTMVNGDICVYINTTLKTAVTKKEWN